MKETYFHNKIHWFTFLFSVLVIWVHSYNAELYLGNTQAAFQIDWMERFLGDTVAQIAVPGFFMISSYLFFRNFTPDKLLGKWNSRIKSILVPYILWNVLYYLGYVVGSRLPVICNIIGKGRIPFNLFTAIDAILHYRFNYVFWYLYQLILLIVLAPVIYLAVKRLWSGILFLLVILVSIYLGISLPQLNLDALFYYSFAAFLAVHGRGTAEAVWSVKRCLPGTALLLFACIIRKINLPGDSFGELAATVVVFRLLTPVSLWLIIPEGGLPEAGEWMKQNFFLYAVHFALVRLINKTGALLLPPIPFLSFFLFILMPVLVVPLSWLIGTVLKKTMPPVWRLLNGGR